MSCNISEEKYLILRICKYFKIYLKLIFKTLNLFLIKEK